MLDAVWNGAGSYLNRKIAKVNIQPFKNSLQHPFYCRLIKNVWLLCLINCTMSEISVQNAFMYVSSEDSKSNI